MHFFSHLVSVYLVPEYFFLLQRHYAIYIFSDAIYASFIVLLLPNIWYNSLEVEVVAFAHD